MIFAILQIYQSKSVTNQNRVQEKTRYYRYSISTSYNFFATMLMFKVYKHFHKVVTATLRCHTIMKILVKQYFHFYILNIHLFYCKICLYTLSVMHCAIIYSLSNSLYVPIFPFVLFPLNTIYSYLFDYLILAYLLLFYYCIICYCIPL